VVVESPPLDGPPVGNMGIGQHMVVRQSVVDGASTATYSDPDPGLNASASLVSAGGRLIAVRFSMAL